MNKKIIGLVVALAIVVGAVAGIIAHWTSNPTTVAGYYPSNYSSIFVTPNKANGDTYTLAWGKSPYGTSTILIDVNGNIVGNIVQTSSSKNAFGPVFLSASGYAPSLATSTTFTGSQLSAITNQVWQNTNAIATATLPAATTTYLAFGNPNLGEQFAFQVTNDSTNTINYVAGTNVSFKCETQGVGTDTLASSATCSSSQVSISATSTVGAQIYWDTASSSEVILWGNQWH